MNQDLLKMNKDPRWYKDWIHNGLIMAIGHFDGSAEKNRHILSLITKLLLKLSSPYNRPRRPKEVEVLLYSFLNLGARLRWVVNATIRPFCRRERPGTHCIGGWVGPRAGLDGCGKCRPTGIWSPDRPARSDSLYQLSYSCPNRASYI
jgi:hypothetical protein